MSRSLVIVCVCLFCVSVLGAVWAVINLERQVESQFGLPDPDLSFIQRISYSYRLLHNQSLLMQPFDNAGKQRLFEVQQGEPASMVAKRLAQEGFIADARIFEVYLLYTGLDIHLQAGRYQLSAASNMIEIAQALRDSTSKEVLFVILPGWRLEEIVAALPTSGLTISASEFLYLSQNPSLINLPSNLSNLSKLESLEGFLLPDNYPVTRNINAETLLQLFLKNFETKVTPEMQLAFEKQGLNLKQAVTLASIVEREAMIVEEQPIIAAVFLNRLSAGMLLQSDPTVQYALGYNQDKQTWWTNPLSADQLKVVSPYNTYLYPGLPPGPICNPSLSALQAVANPQKEPKYYYFRSSCDGSGRHNFATTYEEHLINACK